MSVVYIFVSWLNKIWKTETELPKKNNCHVTCNMSHVINIFAILIDLFEWHDVHMLRYSVSPMYRSFFLSTHSNPLHYLSCFCVYCWTKRLSIQYMWCSTHHKVKKKNKIYITKKLLKSADKVFKGYCKRLGKVGWNFVKIVSL